MRSRSDALPPRQRQQARASARGLRRRARLLRGRARHVDPALRFLSWQRAQRFERRARRLERLV